ncbi:hypothetical protein MNBD_NITROSPINAE05-380 [hydrothermal vent metagenome]|uniref:Uncharacterized protein n=1 Tax=hydrothermal vent metagenome TaxID=652676 RepID=A0A3B1CP76_9ZZZZ
MQVRLKLMGAVLILTTLSAPGLAQQTESEQTGKQQEEKGREIPTLEFLEFLGEWETEDGRWIDPEELDQMSMPDTEKKNEEEDETN